jgi:formate dehydrogenase maturation protein FdhE
MAIHVQDQQVLTALKAAREKHPELADLLDFYLDLYRVQFQLKGELPEPRVRDELGKRWRLEGGIPQLSFDQLGIEDAAFRETASRVAAVLVRYYVDWDLDPEAWTGDALVGRALEVFENWETLTAPAPGQGAEFDGPANENYARDVVVGFSLAPYLQIAAETIRPTLELEKWRHGHCPICGGKPNFSVLDEDKGARNLMCSRCACLWSYARVGCPFCSTGVKSLFHPSEDGLHRLYVCPECNRYLKAVDLRKARRAVVPMVERLLTVGMDLAARQEGYEG